MKLNYTKKISSLTVEKIISTKQDTLVLFTEAIFFVIQ